MTSAIARPTRWRRSVSPSRSPRIPRVLPGRAGILLDLGERLRDPPLYRARKRPHPRVVGPDEARDDVRVELGIARRLDALALGHRAERLAIRLPLEPRAAI